MELLPGLEELGLSRHEAAVYLALLQLGPSSVLRVAKRAALKRPTVYLILDELLRRNLVALAPQEKKKVFLALPPDRLQEDFSRRRATLQNILPELSALYRKDTAKPVVQFFESRDGILGVYRRFLKIPTTEEMLSFFSIEAIPKEFEESYDIFIDLYKSGVRGREIVFTRNARHPYLVRLSRIPTYEARLTTDKMKFFNDTFIYGKEIALVSFEKRFALTIESNDVANSFRSLFELAWQSAKPIR
jgi:sugar-specific transcriptional regulator TrmB